MKQMRIIAKIYIYYMEFFTYTYIYGFVFLMSLFAAEYKTRK